MRPTNVEVFPSGELGVVWEDGHESIYPGRMLRCACRCALCVDEVTGRRLLDDRKVPASVRPLEARPVGNYGLSISFDDGHATGIYPIRWLREACPCGEGH